MGEQRAERNNTSVSEKRGKDMTSFDIDEETNVKKDRCEGCEYCRTVIASGQWQFYGCYCPPYKGKWVAEIKECPKEET